MPIKYYTHNLPFKLESGDVLPQITIAYSTYGEFDGDNAIWICHALTANSEVDDWWPNVICEDGFLNPQKHFMICANIIGSHYGSTGPLSENPNTGEPYYDTFPFITVRDIANAHYILAQYLNISNVKAIIGSSIGGYQAMEMALMYPKFTDKLVLIATSAKNQPWVIAFNESQRMAIECDPSYGDADCNAGSNGMKVARSIGLLSYRGSNAYNATQQEIEDNDKVSGFRASTYQQYQGEKLCSRFNAYSYRILTQVLDSHNVGRGRGGVESALSQIECKTMVVGISTDIIFPVSEQIFLYKHIPNATIQLLSSEFGHDGFLVEYAKLNSILIPFIN